MMILFFFTVFLYFWEIYQKSNTPKHFLLLIFTFTLAVLTKLPGFFLMILLAFVFFQKKLYREKYFYFSLLFLAPAVFWYIRNWVIFGNPVWPQLMGIFKSQYDYIITNYRLFCPVNEQSLDFKIYFLDWLRTFPMVLAAFYAMIKQKKWPILITIILMFFFELKIISSGNLPGIMRHFYSLFGVLLVYGIIGLTEIRSRLLLSLVFLFSVLPLFF